jgi:hypothetical protein
MSLATVFITLVDARNGRQDVERGKMLFLPWSQIRIMEKTVLLLEVLSEIQEHLRVFIGQQNFVAAYLVYSPIECEFHVVSPFTNQRFST